MNKEGKLCVYNFVNLHFMKRVVQIHWSEHMIHIGMLGWMDLNVVFFTLKPCATLCFSKMLPYKGPFAHPR